MLTQFGLMPQILFNYLEINFSPNRNNNIPKIPEEYNNLMLTWSLFCKETLPDRTFTFWEWFYRILLLTSHNMGRLWKEGYIMGFVMKQAAEKMLLQQQNGCFLLRFSDSELGGVTIAYVRKPDFRKLKCFMHILTVLKIVKYY